jgi:uncharacterized membrane protein
MAKLNKSITINAPVDKVFEFVTEPTNLPKFWPSLIEVRDVKRSGDWVESYHWVYKMAGVKFEGDTELSESLPKRRVVAVNSGGIPSEFVWNYAPEGEGTRVTVDVEYKVPGALLGKLAEPLVIKMNEREAETLLANLKAMMEA